MNPFEKRDKIPRTPPGHSFVERSLNDLDQTGVGDCSLYDESGVRSFCVPENLKRYTLTFNPSPKDSRPLAPSQRYSWMLNGQLAMFTSSPVRSEKTCAIVLNKIPSRDEVDDNKENLAIQSSVIEPETVWPRGKRRKDISELSGDQDSIPPTPNELSFDTASAEPATVRRLRSRDVSVDSSTLSVAAHPRPKRRKQADSVGLSDSSRSSTDLEQRLTTRSNTRRGRRNAVHRSLSKLKTPVHSAVVEPMTPCTVVAKPIRTPTALAEEQTSPVPTTVVRREPIATVVKLPAKRELRMGKGISKDGTPSPTTDSAVDQPETVVRPSRAKPVPASVPCSVTLDVLDFSTVTPASSRQRRRRVLSKLDSFSQDAEPIAARLRRNATQVSCLEPRMTRTVGRRN
ncbi:hypothetical protein CLF_108389 [Clonorchis sinensis]|uniref:Uncharacterized protein n=1 Tax=Clonorchis sinensis TaxID=79923 RepID=G7YHZ8_CLOSI|nr:hypothetical protein CLF_108389 [Clonorchis sinensis]